MVVVERSIRRAAALLAAPVPELGKAACRTASEQRG
jgi:hypothetical protein